MVLSSIALISKSIAFRSYSITLFFQRQHGHHLLLCQNGLKLHHFWEFGPYHLFHHIGAEKDPANLSEIIHPTFNLIHSDGSSPAGPGFVHHHHNVFQVESDEGNTSSA